MSVVGLVPQESTVTLPKGAAVWGGEDEDYDLRLPDRHNSWKHRRQLVYDAFRSAFVPYSREHAFLTCGYGAWVLKDPDRDGHYAIVPKYCHDRFCDPCSRQRAWIIKKNLCEHLSSVSQEQPVQPAQSSQKPCVQPEQTRQKPSVQLTGTPCRFVTLTLKSGSEPLGELLDKLRDSFTALRKLPFWRSCVEGGVAFLEVKWSRRAARWHPHLHIICHGSWISKRRLSDEWKAITGDSFIVDIGLIKSTADVLRYVTKYVTKGFDDRTFEDQERLIEAVLAMKGRKLCGAFGDWSRLHLLNVETDVDWNLLCPLDQLGDLARSGDSDALAVVTHLHSLEDVAADYTVTPRAPPIFYSLGLLTHNPRRPHPDSLLAQFQKAS